MGIPFSGGLGVLTRKVCAARACLRLSAAGRQFTGPGETELRPLGVKRGTRAVGQTTDTASTRREAGGNAAWAAVARKP
jgi:hypothetical protein